MRCLWLAGEVPYPIESGLRAYSSGVATALARAGADVTALAFDGESSGARPEDGIDWRSVPGAPLGRARSAVSVLPAMAFAYRSPAYVAALDRALDDEQFDVVLIDHLQMGWAAAHLARRASKGRRPLVVLFPRTTRPPCAGRWPEPRGMPPRPAA